MLEVIGCLTSEHDLRLVLLAAAICALSAGAMVSLLRHAKTCSSMTRAVWLVIAACAGGSGVWATHFIAMLAFEPGIPSGYDIGCTALSLAVSIAAIGAALTIATRSGYESVGGAILGLGAGAMHYTGMAAFLIEGHIVWSPALILASMSIGALIGAASLPFALKDGWKSHAAAAALLVLAICGLHFTAMGAVSIMPDPTISVPRSAAPNAWLALAAALASFIILVLAGAALFIDLRDREHATQRSRMASLVNASAEGLVLCRHGAIVQANDNFARLVGTNTHGLDGQKLLRFLPQQRFPLRADEDGRPGQAELRAIDGTAIPVELIIRVVEPGSDPLYALAVRDLRARRQAEREIQFLAHHDALTSLLNRASFDRELSAAIEHAASSEGKLAVLCLDLDRFKEINDLFGHAAGDTALRSVAERLCSALSANQTAARLGGDEFAILAPIKQRSEAGALAKRIVEALAVAAPSGIQLASSIGIAIYPDDATDRQVLLGRADIALYKAKSEGRGSYRLFDALMGAELQDRRKLELDLRHAVARGEFSIAYQPQCAVASREAFGFEALLRWRHPQRGMVSPAVFIPIAEESGAIIAIGEWVLRQACREAAAWNSPHSVAVNVSGVQLHSARFADFVHAVLFDTGLAPARLEIEITETALIRDLPRALSVLRHLKALGVKIAMDDFGTGYSSLSNLRAFPFDRIKIDRTFVHGVDHNEQSAAILRAVLALGGSLGLPVLAEGVETEAELAFLKREGCSAAQGYLLGRPGPSEAFGLVNREEAAPEWRVA